jgi:hypothetical protein
LPRLPKEEVAARIMVEIVRIVRSKATS